MNVSVDFSHPVGKIKPMHGGNFGPRQGGAKLTYDFSKEFEAIGVPFARLHDVEYPYGQNQFVDVHCIFPNFEADETLPESYHFASTDEYLSAIVATGCQVFYRLGESIDHFPQPLYVHPPKDFQKWARICEHIIRHYNEGWAEGFHFGIRYWEIWNEPDNRKMWTGTREQFFELYRVTANHLKACFGDTIRVGGYAATGFYMLNRTANMRDWFYTLVPYMEDFLRYITAPETRAPIDFFSWHCYADTPEEVALHAGFARELLKKYGLGEIESILDEFNLYYCFSEFSPLHKGCFADLAASMILAQKSSLDVLMHYDFGARPNTYNNIFTVGMDNKTVLHYAGYESMADFGALYRLGTEVETHGDAEGAVNLLAAVNETEGGLLLCSRTYSGEITLRLDGVPFPHYQIKRTTDDPSGCPVITVSEKFSIGSEPISLQIQAPELVYLRLL